MRFLILFITLFNFAFSQSDVINLKPIMDEYDFQPKQLCANNTGIYLLDMDYRQILFIANDNTIKHAGGYGITDEAFIDPIDILTSKLNVWVVDATGNRLIAFDHKLNYLNTVDFNEIYPTLSTIDDWGNILLFSQLENAIYKFDNSSLKLNQFIDMSIYYNSDLSPVDIYSAENGEIGILYPGSVLIFNRLGRSVKHVSIVGINRFLTNIDNIWYVIDQENELVSLNDNQDQFNLSEQVVSDIYQNEEQLFILVEDKISVINVQAE